MAGAGDHSASTRRAVGGRGNLPKNSVDTPGVTGERLAQQCLNFCRRYSRRKGRVVFEVGLESIN